MTKLGNKLATIIAWKLRKKRLDSNNNAERLIAQKLYKLANRNGDIYNHIKVLEKKHNINKKNIEAALRKVYKHLKHEYGETLDEYDKQEYEEIIKLFKEELENFDLDEFKKTILPFTSVIKRLEQSRLNRNLSVLLNDPNYYLSTISARGRKNAPEIEQLLFQKGAMNVIVAPSTHVNPDDPNYPEVVYNIYPEKISPELKEKIKDIVRKTTGV